jgi:hypothetical protein
LFLTFLYSGLLLAVYAKWWAWHGGLYWGPRFLLPVSVFGAVYWIVLVKTIWRNAGRPVRIVLIILAILSYIVYKNGAAINHRYLAQCLALDSASDTCFWKVLFLPYTSLFSSDDLIRMLTHRSTLVELGGIALMGALTGLTTIHGER